MIMNRIGVFDSGMGGLTILEKLVENIPNCDYIYLADEANVPYGTKTDEELLNILKKVIKFFKLKQVDLIIIACNTASCYIEELKCETTIPMFGMIDITAAEVLKNKNIKRVLLLATAQTVKHHKYDDILKKNGIEVIGIPCPGFITYIESEYKPASSYQDALIKEQLRCVLGSDFDAVILGCTHFGLVRSSIEKLFKNALVISSEEATSEHLKNTETFDYNKKGFIEIYTSGDSESFNKKLTYFKDLPKVSKKI